MEVILFNSKTLETAWLSNFAWSQFWLNTSLGPKQFCCVEAAYQCAKHRPEDLTLEVIHRWCRMEGLEAKRAGKAIAVRPDWETRKVGVMRMLLERKFAPGTDFAARLLATGDERLVHLSPWDLFWGADDAGYGENLLGKLIMGIRDGLRAERT